MYKTMILVISLVLCSCVSLKWKYEYVGKRLDSLKKYDNDDTTILLSMPAGLQLDKLKKLKKKKIIKIMDGLEKGAALTPDSIIERNGRIDSFYYNQNKIRYIKDHQLQSNTIRF